MAIPQDRVVPEAIHLVRLYTATGTFDLQAAFAQLGVAVPLSSRLWEAVEVLGRSCLVAVGPKATQLWSRYLGSAISESVNAAAVAAAAADTKHTDVVCWNCKHFVLAGTCEHTHAALLELGRISTVVSSVPRQKPRGPLGRGERAASTALPAIERSGDGLACPPAARPSADSATGRLGDRRISKLLGVLGFEASEHVFTAAGVE